MRDFALATRALFAFASLFVSSLALAGCLSVGDPPEGRLACTVSSDCPTGWVCRADMLCWRNASDVDAGRDAGMDASADVGVGDGGNDGGGTDTSVDGGGSDTGLDAGMADASHDGGVDAPECFAAGDCDDSNACTTDGCSSGTCTHVTISCDDSAACTTDACSTTAGCVHLPSDAMCAVGRTCMPGGAGVDTNGCVRAPDCTTAAQCDDMLFCTIDTCSGTGSCVHTARVCSDDSNLCTSAPLCTESGGGAGACTLPFDPASLTDITHCGTSAATCAVCTSPHPTRVATCAAGACSAPCGPGLVDVDGIASNGCECTRLSATDDSDDLAADANCDGADGEIGVGSRHIYVVPGGAGSHNGTSPANAADMGQGFTLFAARVSAGVTNVQILAASGDYMISAPLVAPDGLNLFGGYAADFRSRSGVSRVVSTAPVALQIRNVTRTTIDSVNFETLALAGAGAYTHTIDVVMSTGVLLRRMRVVAGNGGDGSPGARGTDVTTAGAIGQSGGNGTSPGGGSGGPTPGGRGGTGGPGGTGGMGGAGLNGTGFMAGVCGLGSGGGAGITFCMTGFANSADPGLPGIIGCAGARGSHGAGGSSGGSVASGMWMPSTGGMGGTGSTGTFGGGGGGGGGAQCGTASNGGGGGGAGGGGGSGGGGGVPGQPGGASIAILATDSTLALDTVVLVTGRGGAGGAGGAGGTGGPGGAGGMGGSGITSSLPGTTAVSSGNGGRGGTGGTGGDGGCGGGGAGGPSVGIFGRTVAVTTTAVTYTLGVGGAGGATCGVSGASGGAAGVASMTQGF